MLWRYSWWNERGSVLDRSQKDDRVRIPLMSAAEAFDLLSPRPSIAIATVGHADWPTKGSGA
jgi:hypothetical protein